MLQAILDIYSPILTCSITQSSSSILEQLRAALMRVTVAMQALSWYTMAKWPELLFRNMVPSFWVLKLS